MGKSIDFTKTGGVPVTQRLFKFMQDSYLPVLDAIVKMGGDSTGVPIILSGMVVSGGGNTVSDGWFVYNGDIIPFTGGTVTPGVGEVALVVITEYSDPAVPSFYDSTTPDIFYYKTAALTNAATVTDATHYPVSALKRFGVGMGEANRESAWSSIAVTTGAGNGTITGTIYYKKDFLSNTVRVRGILSVTTPGDFSASPALTTIGLAAVGALPSGYRPVAAVFFGACAFDLSGNRIANDAGDSYIDQVSVSVNTNGSITGYFIKPDAGVSAYLINFYQTIPID